MAQPRQHTISWLEQNDLPWYAPGSSWNLKLKQSSLSKSPPGSTTRQTCIIALHPSEMSSAIESGSVHDCPHWWKGMVCPLSHRTKTVNWDQLLELPDAYKSCALPPTDLRTEFARLSAEELLKKISLGTSDPDANGWHSDSAASSHIHPCYAFILSRSR